MPDSLKIPMWALEALDMTNKRLQSGTWLAETLRGHGNDWDKALSKLQKCTILLESARMAVHVLGQCALSARSFCQASNTGQLLVPRHQRRGWKFPFPTVILDR